MAKCLECIHWKPCFNSKEWDAAIASPCKYFSPDIIVGGKTNADRIRTMSDEELAEFLAAKCADIQAQNAFTKESPPTATQLSALSHTWYCQWMYWLKQPVKGGEDDAID